MRRLWNVLILAAAIGCHVNPGTNDATERLHDGFRDEAVSNRGWRTTLNNVEVVSANPMGHMLVVKRLPALPEDFGLALHVDASATPRLPRLKAGTRLDLDCLASRPPGVSPIDPMGLYGLEAHARQRHLAREVGCTSITRIRTASRR